MTTSLASEPELLDEPLFPDWPTLVGYQDPLHLLVDDGDLSEAEKAITLATRVRKEQMPWQGATLNGILTLEPDGMFTHPTAVVIACRQNGKTLSAAELRIVYGAFARHETVVYSAQRWITAKAIYLRIKTLINRRPSLKRRAYGWICSQGVAGFTVRHDDGSESPVMFITRSGDFRGPDEIDLLVYDEAYNLTDSEMAAISPTQLAAHNPQTIYLSSAVNQEIHANGQVLANIRHRALQAIKAGLKRTGLFYAEYAAPPPADDMPESDRRALREDPATWRRANPSYGVIQTEAKVRKLLTELSPKAFEVECLGWGDWPAVAEMMARPITKERWAELTDADPELINAWPQVIAVDRSPLSNVWSITGMQYRRDGHAHGEIGYSRKASVTEVLEFLVDVVTDANPMALIIDQKSAAAVLKPYLEAVGIEPVMTNLSELALACQGVLDAVDADQVSHSGQQILTDSIAVTIKRELPRGQFVWDAAPGGLITHSMSFTLAHWGLLTFGKTPRKPSPPPMAATDEWDSTGGREFDAMTAAF